MNKIYKKSASATVSRNQEYHRNVRCSKKKKMVF